jgi:cell division transport system permease protein
MAHRESRALTMAQGTILSRLPVNTKIGAYGREHLRTLIGTLGKLYRAPLSSIMTTTVIGVALALPGGLYVLLANLQVITSGWENPARISLFLKLDTAPDAMEALAERLRTREDVANVNVIEPDEALREFRAESGFGDALDALPGNPLPAVLVVSPAVSRVPPERISAMAQEIERAPEVDLAQVDMQWLQRLQGIIDIARRLVTTIAVLLGLAVLLIVGNTIRLDTQNRREEIEVIKLVGGTDAFIRRPFLYGGIWYGLLGGVLAWLLIGTAMLLLAGPASELARLYDSEHQLFGLGTNGTILLLGMGAALGLCGSWLAVGRHLSAIAPR